MNNPVLHPGARPGLAKKVRFQTDRVTGKPILLFPEGALVLNPTGAAIVRLCDGQKTVTEIVAELGLLYQTPPEALADDTATYLLRLHERNLVSWDDPLPEPEAPDKECPQMENPDIERPK